MLRRWLEAFEQFAIDVILQRRYGKRAALLRWFLYALSWIFRGIVQTRLWLFRKRLLRQHTPGCLVISIGNLTVGGTGSIGCGRKIARSRSQSTVATRTFKFLIFQSPEDSVISG